ncbi:MAG: arsenate reductase ArsC [Gemmatimonadales bacterium]|jgi:arsenate reductase
MSVNPVRPHAEGAPGPRGILFLCVANSARSQIAEGLARDLAPPEVHVYSAGSEPGTINPLAVRVLAEAGVDASAQRSKGLDAVPLDAVDLVVTLCAEEVCPLFPRPVRTLHWPLPDPARAEGTEDERLAAFRAVRDDLAGRIPSLFRAGG